MGSSFPVHLPWCRPWGRLVSHRLATVTNGSPRKQAFLIALSAALFLTACSERADDAVRPAPPVKDPGCGARPGAQCPAEGGDGSYTLPEFGDAMALTLEAGSGSRWTWSDRQ